MKRILSILLVILMILPLCPQAEAAQVQHNYSQTANSGVRHEVCTTLEGTHVNSYYTGEYTYNKLTDMSSGTLLTSLRKLMTNTHTKKSNYDDCHYKANLTDCENGDSTSINFIYSSYSGTQSDWAGSTNVGWNREHVWPKSLGGFNTSGAGADLHHLRPSDAKINSTRGNKLYGNVSGGTTVKGNSYNGTSFTGGAYSGNYFEPLDNAKGDVARICLYMYVRYGGESQYTCSSITTVFQSVDVLLEWCAIDPVDTWEMGRNEVIHKLQGNRNVFIDYPELAWQLFGKTAPEGLVTPSGNTGGSGSGSGSEPSNPTVTEPVVTEPVTTDPPASGDIKPGTGYNVFVNNGVYAMYFDGTITSGRFNCTENATNAAVVYIEEVSDGVRLYMLDGSSKKYICMDDKSAGGRFATSASDATIYEWKPDLKTYVVADPDNGRAFGAQDNSSYKSMSAYATSNTSGYQWGQFIEVAGTTPPVTAPGNHEGHTTISGKNATHHWTICSCGDESTKVMVAHSFKLVGKVDATCTAAGYTGDTKCDCGYIQTNGSTITAKGHTEVTDPGKAATCSASGLTEGKHCSVCNTIIVKQTTIPAKAHTPGATANCTDPQICTVCNAVIQQSKGHTPGAAATCTTPQICTVCKIVLTPAKGHTPGAAATCTAPQMCTVCQEISAPSLGHIFQNGSCTRAGCGALDPQCQHRNTKIEGAVAPTCTKLGRTGNTLCLDCNSLVKASSSIAATGHVPGAAADCTTPQVCTVCHEVLKSALGHTTVTDNGKAPTCTTTGLTEGKHCSTCHTVLVVQQVLPAKGHSYAGGKCTVCQAADPDYVAPTEPKPTEPKPTEPKPTEPKPTEPKPTEPKPTKPADPEKPDTLAGQIAEANKLANKEHLPYESTITGTIMDDPKLSSYNEGAYRFTVSDGKNSLTCYYVPVSGGVPAKGDTITITGKLTAYNGVAQFDETATAILIQNNPTDPQPSEPAGDPTCDHSNTVKRDVKDATCGVPGYTGDEYCSKCGKLMAAGTVIEATNDHHFGEWVIVQQPTALIDGLRERECTVCTHRESEAIPAGENNATEGKDETQPDVTEPQPTPSTPADVQPGDQSNYTWVIIAALVVIAAVCVVIVIPKTKAGKNQ